MSQGYTIYYTKLEDGTILAASNLPCITVSAPTLADAKEKVSKALSFHERRKGEEPVVPTAWTKRATKSVRPFAPFKVEHLEAGDCIAA